MNKQTSELEILLNKSSFFDVGKSYITTSQENVTYNGKDLQKANGSMRERLLRGTFSPREKKQCFICQKKTEK